MAAKKKAPAKKSKKAKKAAKGETMYASLGFDEYEDNILISVKKPAVEAGHCYECGNPQGKKELMVDSVAEVCKYGFEDATGILLNPGETIQLSVKAVGKAIKL